MYSYIFQASSPSRTRTQVMRADEQSQEEMLRQLDPRFYTEEFDPVAFMLGALPVVLPDGV